MTGAAAHIFRPTRAPERSSRSGIRVGRALGAYSAILRAVARGAWGRIAFAVAAGLTVVALALHGWTWWRTGTINWPAAVNMSGLLLLTVVGAIDPSIGRVWFVLSIISLLLIVPSAFLLWLR